jgi:hypothetical protein
LKPTAENPDIGLGRELGNFMAEKDGLHGEKKPHPGLLTLSE